MKYKPMKYLTFIIIFVTLFLTIRAEAYADSLYSGQNEENIPQATGLGIDYLKSQINKDGGIRWTDENSSVPATIRLVLVLASNNFSQDKIISDSGLRPIDYLSSEAFDWVMQKDTDLESFNVSRAGLLLTAIAAANENPHDFGDQNTDFVYDLKAVYDPNAAVFGDASPDNVLDQVWAIIGLAANHASIPEDAVLWLMEAQQADGSWNDGYGSFLDTTPLGVMALIAAGLDRETPEIQSAIKYIKANQQENGGWQTQWDTSTNANTTGTILSMIYSIGDKPTDPQWQNATGSPISALLSIQQKNGSFGTGFANAYSTADALIGLSGKPIFKLGMLKRISDTVDYLVSQQKEDGGWGSLGQTIDVILAMQAAGWDSKTLIKAGNSPVDYMTINIDPTVLSGPDITGKIILGAVATGTEPENFYGLNLIESLRGFYNEDTQTFGDASNTWHQTYAVLALIAADHDLPTGLVENIICLQKDDGGWEYSAGMGTSPDTTAFVLQGLVAAGLTKNEEVVIKALDYLKSKQQSDGGWGDSSATSFVIMALNALKDNLDNWETQDRHEPLSSLFNFQKANGSFFFTKDYPEDNLMSTGSALLALSKGSYASDFLAHSTKNSAGVMIFPDITEHQSSCVTFQENSLTGLELLENSGFEFDLQNGFMNSILGLSNPKGETLYWSYWYWDGREWNFKNTGINESIVMPGSIEAWYLTSWENFPSLPPRFAPDLSIICNQMVLKNYQVQPYLTFEDIQILSNSQTSIEVEQVDTQSETQTTNLSNDAEGDQVSEKNQPSAIPLLIVSSVGIVAIIFVIIVLHRRKK